ncbi:MAG: hypothetical protein HN712_24040 [Gemmatimonadetes bacterium]|nr:hypothetical protein [Gemmatimonadota bacterium]MBT7863410.1 hypothetical protein [Gemmatimonadota bacterium]
MLKLLLFAALCTLGYKLMAKLRPGTDDEAENGESPTTSGRKNVVDAQFEVVETEDEHP